MTGADSDTRADGDAWPALLRIRPAHLLIAVAACLVLAWTAFLAVDIVNVGGIGDRLYRPMWHHLFNNRPVEWAQWFLLALAIVASAYLAGRLKGERQAGAAVFFFLLSIGLGLMIIEEAGDIRHDISTYVRDHIGNEVLGLPYRVAAEVPYFTALAIVPLYAFARYGRYAWRAPSTRPFTVTTVTLYGIAAIGSALRHYRDLYELIGARVDAWLLGGRFPPRLNMSQEWTHFFVVDGPIEESIELVAAACMLAMVLAYIGDLRARRIPEQTHPETAPAPASGLPDPVREATVERA